MANSRTLTSANAVLLIGVTGLFDAPQRIEGFSADDISDTDAIEPAELSMGIDGRLSAGYVPNPVAQNITLQADSLSNDLFENWVAAEQSLREKFTAFGLLLIPATSRKYTLSRGFLKSIPITPSLKRTLQPRRFVITWERVAPSPN